LRLTLLADGSEVLPSSPEACRPGHHGQAALSLFPALRRLASSSAFLPRLFARGLFPFGKHNMTSPHLFNLEILKYPRTPHLRGSRLQVGDQDDAVPYERWPAGISWSRKAGRRQCGAELWRRRQLAAAVARPLSASDQMGGRERQFNYKQWAQAHEGALMALLDDRYVMYGEWLYAKHSLYYDALPHWFCEFDIWDRSAQQFLDTPQRHALLDGVPVVSVPVLYAGIAPGACRICWHCWPPLGRSARWRRRSRIRCKDRSWICRCLAPDRPIRAGRRSVYQGRGKRPDRGALQVRAPDFVQVILESGSHHSERPIVANGLRTGVDIFANKIQKSW
jgi:hypothetical protein